MPKTYDSSMHKRCFELWMNGMSKKAIARMEGTPGRRQLIKWSKEDYDCDCGWHGWDKLKAKIRKQKMEGKGKGEIVERRSLELSDEELEALDYKEKLDRLEFIAWKTLLSGEIRPTTYHEFLQTLQFCAKEREGILTEKGLEERGEEEVDIEIV